MFLGSLMGMLHLKAEIASQSLIHLGGALSRPAVQYPSVFGRVQFFKDYPYALPTFTTGAIGATACVVSALFIKEVSNLEYCFLYAAWIKASSSWFRYRH